MACSPHSRRPSRQLQPQPRDRGTRGSSSLPLLRVALLAAAAAALLAVGAEAVSGRCGDPILAGR
eukprot:359739-Chlamydomonas_euryale.AAC.5